MPQPFHETALQYLPNLTAENYRITSPPSWEYNCIAWALKVTNAWWWPVPGRYWPPDVPREETVDAFLAAFATQSFVLCSTPELEAGWDKIALYSLGSVPTHAARQLPDGWWTSKLGPNIDIEHASVHVVAGGVYGNPVVFLSRKISAQTEA